MTKRGSLEMKRDAIVGRGTMMIATLAAICIYCPAAFGQTTERQAPSQESPQVEELLKRIQALEKKNRGLEEQNERLQDQLDDASGDEEAEPIDIREIPVDDEDYRFLTLGTQ